jgi:NAD(P)-dependent dehydrogenase (short-subunit alcohol dehydrogenase family)
MSGGAAPRVRAWLITGISSGIGREVARQLLAAGHPVAGTTRDPDSVADLKDQFGERLWTATLDVTAPSDVKDVVDRAFADLGHIDAVVSNAGYGAFGAAEEFTDAQIEHHLATNLLGSIALARAALPHLRAQGGGRIIQISTYGGQAANPGASLYNAGKFGIEGFMEALSKEVEPFDIRVTIAEPGGTRTNFRANALLASALAAYDNTPAAFVRTLPTSTMASPVDPERAARLIIESVDRTPAPLRLILGSDSYRYIQGAVASRLQDIESQQADAARADYTQTDGG